MIETPRRTASLSRRSSVAGRRHFGGLNQPHVIVAGWGYLCGLNQFQIRMTSRSNFADFDNLHVVFLLFQITYDLLLDAVGP